MANRMKALAVSGIICCSICKATVKTPHRVTHYTIMKITIPKTNSSAANSFLNLPVGKDRQNPQAEAIVFDVPHGKPYFAEQFPNNQSTASAALFLLNSCQK